MRALLLAERAAMNGKAIEGMLHTPTPPTTFERHLAIGIAGRGIAATAVSRRTFTNMEGGKIRPYKDSYGGGLINNYKFTNTQVKITPRQ